jgi:hypothetical protein
MQLVKNQGTGNRQRGTEKMGVADFMYETGSLQTETVVETRYIASLHSLFPIPHSPFPTPYSPFPTPYSLFPYLFICQN